MWYIVILVCVAIASFFIGRYVERPAALTGEQISFREQIQLMLSTVDAHPEQWTLVPFTTMHYNEYKCNFRPEFYKNYWVWENNAASTTIFFCNFPHPDKEHVIVASVLWRKTVKLETIKQDNFLINQKVRVWLREKQMKDYQDALDNKVEFDKLLAKK